ncbi:MAG: hypothetical protein PHF67_02740 [Candidatus Nanoarchaeia archaeon]|nr:hypothetical protein [Candidatus Nanoarchaeia archaeon]
MGLTFVDLTDEEESTIGDRICREAERPFLIEPFCAEVSWMEVKSCPVYPYNRDSEKPCRFLYDADHPDYRCPNARYPQQIFESILTKGNTKQKKALEYYADMCLRYGKMENPPAKPDSYALYYAYYFYRRLNLKEKAEAIEKIHPEFKKWFGQ